MAINVVLSAEDVQALVAAAMDIMSKGRARKLHRVYPVLDLHPSHLHGATQELLVASGLCANHEEARAWMTARFEWMGSVKDD